MERVVEAGCPHVLTFQEVGPAQRELLPVLLPEICDGEYERVSDRLDLPVEQWIVSTLPVGRAASAPISGVSRSVQLVVLESDWGLVNVATTHFVASIDNLPCNTELCTEICEPGVEAGACNPREVLAFLDAEAEPSAPTLLTGDLNAEITEPRLVTLTDAGFTDLWVEAGNPECDPGTTTGCTSGIHGEGPYDGLDTPVRTFSERIDFVLARIPDTCRLDLDSPEDDDGDGTSTGPFSDGPAPETRSGIYWASDHGGVQVDLSC
jgi:hypothetical protein